MAKIHGASFVISHRMPLYMAAIDRPKWFKPARMVFWYCTKTEKSTRIFADGTVSTDVGYSKGCLIDSILVIQGQLKSKYAKPTTRRR